MLEHPLIQRSESIGLVTALKGTVAVVIAWVIANSVFHSPEAFLAPYAALFIIGNTVRNSMRVAARQVSVVVLGVIVAAIAAATLPTVAALALATGAGILVGRIPRLSPDGIWVAVTAVLVLLYGTATNPYLVVHRIGDVVLGVFVGITVNAVLVPPDYLSDARDLLVARTHEVSDILRQMADDVKIGASAHGLWRQRALSVNKSVTAEAVVMEGEASLVGNFRKRGWLRRGGSELFRPAADALDRAALHLMGLILAVEDNDFDENENLQGAVSDLLEAMAEAFADAGRGPVRDPIDHRAVTTLPLACERLAELEKLLQQGRVTTSVAPSIILSSRGLLTTLAVLDREECRTERALDRFSTPG
ncbi:FUSC family protein [Rhodococcus globerulus]|uniref:FUSC family protein n=1 Tax=Rhodococcus globerulus TaxID=33008 RepID=UPI00286B3EE8|nr:FUSC family protein [Rhodococcus globerulus]